MIRLRTIVVLGTTLLRQSEFSIQTFTRRADKFKLNVDQIDVTRHSRVRVK
jgi:hypothetical protein